MIRFDQDNRAAYRTMNTTAATLNAIPMWESITDVVYCVITAYLATCQVASFAVQVLRGKIQLQPCSRKFYDPLNVRLQMNCAIVLSTSCAAAFFLMRIVLVFAAQIPAVYAAISVLTQLSLVGMYLVLYFRQVAFYSNPVFKHLTNAVLRVFSYFQGMVIIAVAGLYPITYSLYHVYRYSCVNPSCLPRWIFISIFVTQAELRLALLGLFIWPLAQHRKSSKFLQSRSFTATMRLIRRATAVAAACFVADICSLHFFLNPDDTAIAFNSMLVANLIFTIFCFGNFRERFLPCLTSYPRWVKGSKGQRAIVVSTVSGQSNTVKTK